MTWGKSFLETDLEALKEWFVMLTICVNPHVTESQGLKWGIHPVLTISLIPNILVDPPSKQPAKPKEHWVKSWMTAHGRGWGSWQVLPLSCCTHASMEDSLLEVTQDLPTFFWKFWCFYWVYDSLQDLTTFITHPEEERKKAVGRDTKGQISIQGTFLGFSHSFRLHIALERLGIKMALMNRAVRK